MVELVIVMYKVIMLYESKISAVKAGNVREMTQHTPNMQNFDSINSITFPCS